MAVSSEFDRLKEAQASSASSNQSQNTLDAADRGEADTRHLVVVDSTVEGYQGLLNSMNPDAEVLVISGGGLVALAEALEGESGIQSLQILSHGTAGTLFLGGDQLDTDTIGDHAELLAQIGSTLTEGGDILLYGCNIGEGSEGMAFLEAFQHATGADVAASDDLTGASDKGGDWDLEAVLGDIEATEVLSAGSMASFDALLAPTVGTIDFGTGISILATDGAGPAVNVSGSGLTVTYAGNTDAIDMTIIQPTDAYTSSIDAEYGRGNAWDGKALVFAHVVGAGSGLVGTPNGIDYVSFESDNGADAFDLDGLVFFYRASSALDFTISAHDAAGTQIGSDVSITGFSGANTDGASDEFTVQFATIDDAMLGSDFDNIVEFRITPSDPNAIAVMGVDNIVIDTAVVNTNDDPTGSGLPTDLTFLEDTEGDLDLSTLDLADADSATVTLTITASEGSFGTPADGAGVGGGITETRVSDTEITLAGAPDDIDAYLDTTSNITWTPVLGDAGDDASSFTLSVNDGDGSGDVALGTVNADITAINSPPTASGLPTDISFDQDVAGEVDLSDLNLNDGDSSTVTLTITASEGSFGTPADGAGVGSGVTETRVSDTEITLVGAPDDIDIYLDTTSNITWTPAAGDTGNDTSTFTLTVNDGDGSGDVAIGTVNADVTASGSSTTIIDFGSSIAILATDSAGPATLGGTGLNFSYAGDTDAVDMVIAVPTDAYTNSNNAEYGFGSAWDGKTLMYGHVVGSGSGLVGSAQQIDYISIESDNGADAFDLDGFSFFYRAEAALTFTVSAYDAAGTQIGSDVSITGFSGANTDGASDEYTVQFATIDDAMLGSDFDNIVEFRITPSDPNAVAIMGIDNILLQDAVVNTNDDPTGSGLPTDLTFLEDTEGDLDLSTLDLADPDSATVTLTITASEGSFGTPADGAGIGGGVTETRISDTEITLAGAPDDIDAYLDTTSNITWTPVLGDAGDDASSFTLSVNDGDGSGDIALGTINADITAINSPPTASGLPTDISFDQDTAGEVDLSDLNLNDGDSSTVTLTITASEGSFGTPADGAGVGSGVTETRVSDTEITLVGAPDDIDIYLDTTANITWTPAPGDTGDNTSTFTLTVNDGDGSGDVAVGTVNADVTASGSSTTIIDFGASIQIITTDDPGPGTNVDGSGLSVSYAGNTDAVDIVIAVPEDAYTSADNAEYGFGSAWDGKALMFGHVIGSGSGLVGSAHQIDYISTGSDNSADAFDLDGFSFFYRAEAALTFTVSAYDAAGTQIGSDVSITGFSGANTDGASDEYTVQFATIDDAMLGSDFDNIVEFRITPSDPNAVAIMGIDDIVIQDAAECTGQVIDGTGSRDTLVGTDCGDTITGLGADDQLFGGGGDDILAGGAGQDSLDGGDGNDTFLVDANRQYDLFSGGNGDDTIQAAENDAVVMIRHTFDASNSVEAISADGHSGFSIEGSGSSQTLDFSATSLDGVTAIRGNGGNDAITGSTADDTISGGNGFDNMSGGDGDDTFLVGDGELADTYSGGQGADRILATGDDVGIGVLRGFQGDQSVELISANGHSGVTIEGWGYSQTLDFSGTTLDGITAIRGNGGNDAITGSSGDDTISGGNGFDNLSGGNGDDTFLVGTGELFDTFSGGQGTDSILAVGDNVGIGVLRGFSGDQTVEQISANGHSGVSIEGSNYSQVLDFSGTTLDGITAIRGNGGNDFLTGGAGADTLDGGSGADRLTGGTGNDVLTGGSDGDRFIFAASAGDDVITDFEDGSDRIDLSALSLDFADITLSDVGGDTLIEYLGNSIVLNGVAVSSITEADFLL